MFLKVCLVFLLIFLRSGVGNSEESQDISYRLNNTTEPVAYELWLETKIHERILDYTGRVRIVVRALETANVITINSENLLITNYTFLDHLNNYVKISGYKEYKEQTIVEFVLDEYLRVGQNYILDLRFQGVLRSSPEGFCYSRNVDENEDSSYIATSFLHVTNARMAFPCYDEPQYRTSFLIHMTHHESMRAASNMPVASIRNISEETVTTSFQESVSMPVHLVAFTVSNYESKKVFLPEKNLEISFLVPKQLVNETEFATDFITFILNKYEAYLGVGYNLPKLESVVVTDLMNTGIENWGLMVFDAKSLLYNETLTTPSQKLDIARTICHLLTHNYFGNVVGISWWNDLWIIEGFAYYHEYYFSNFYLVDSPLIEVFVTSLMQRYLVENSHTMASSLNKYVETRREIMGTLNFPLLSKAAAVIRMCDHMLGRATFQKGLQTYIRNMAFKTALPTDLYKSIQEAVNEDGTIPSDIKVEDMLKSWVDQPGYPLLTVMRNYESNEIVVNQQRYFSSRDEIDHEGFSWYIPLSFTTSRSLDMENTKPVAWLTRGSREIVLSAENNSWSSEDWVLFNIQQTGYYRVNYDPRNWNLLAEELHQGYPYKIGTLNRAQLIDDAFNLAYSDVLSFLLALDIIKYVRYEQEYAVWLTANRHLTAMNTRLAGPSYELYFGRFLQHLTEDHFEKLDVFEDINGRDSIRNTLLRPIIVDLACRSGSGKCLTATRIMVTAEALTGHVLVPHENPSVYYCHGLKNADEKTFQYFWKKLKTLTNEQERTHITNSIGCYHDFQSLYFLLLETSDPNQQEVFYTNLERIHILLSAIRNGHVKPVLKFIRENHDNIAKAYTYNTRMEQTLQEAAEYLHEDGHEEFVEVMNILVEAGHINSNFAERCMSDMEYHQVWVVENKIKIENWIGEYFQPVIENSATIILSYLPVLLILIGQIFLATI